MSWVTLGKLYDSCGSVYSRVKRQMHSRGLLGGWDEIMHTEAFAHISVAHCSLLLSRLVKAEMTLGHSLGRGQKGQCGGRWNVLNATLRDLEFTLQTCKQWVGWGAVGLGGMASS